MLHPIVRWLGARGIRWFYRSVEFVGIEKIPDSGPVLLVASHGNDLTDILLTFLVTKRDVLFVANVSAADLFLVKWTFAGLGVIPVARTRDARAMLARGEDVAALNARAFASVTAALKAGNIVAIFPEGVVHDFPHLAPLRTGAAKMALEAVADGVTNLTIASVGFQYEAPWQPRSGVVGVATDAVLVDSWRPTHEDRAVSEFTRLIRQRMLGVTRNSATWNDAEQLSIVAAAAGGALSSAAESPGIAAHRVQRKLTEASGPNGLFVAKSSNPDILAFEQDAIDLTVKSSRFGAKRWSVADQAIVLSAAGDLNVVLKRQSLLWLGLTFPVAALGALWHAIPMWACYALARRTAPTKMEIAAFSIVPGLYLMALWYVSIPLLLLFAGAWPWLVLVLFVVQPRLGDFALQWRDRYRSAQLDRRVRGAAADEKSALLQAAQKLRQSWRNAFPISIP